MNQMKFWIAVGLGRFITKSAGYHRTLGVLPLLVLMWDASVVAWATGLVILCAVDLVYPGGAEVGEPDHGQIVIDEWAGMVGCVWVITFTDFTMWMGLLVGFVGFWIFDIAKPWSVSW